MRARAPRFAANLGPGFDTLALAVDRYVEVEVEPAARLTVRSEGEGAGLSDDAGHLAARVAIDVAGHDRLAITVRSQIPVGRGLGSSAALAAAAAAAAGAGDPLAVAAHIDGHAENAAASVVGGLVAATLVRGAVRAVQLPLDPALRFVVLVPDRTLATTRARQLAAAPGEPGGRRLQPGPDGPAAGRPGRPRASSCGRPPRTGCTRTTAAPLFPEAPKLLAALLAGGALAACWSGAGPSLLGICTQDGLLRRAPGRGGRAEGGHVGGEVLVLQPDRAGLVTGDEARLPGAAGTPPRTMRPGAGTATGHRRTPCGGSAVTARRPPPAPVRGAGAVPPVPSGAVFDFDEEQPDSAGRPGTRRPGPDGVGFADGPQVRHPHLRVPDERARLRAPGRSAGGRRARADRRRGRRRRGGAQHLLHPGERRQQALRAPRPPQGAAGDQPGLQIAVGGCLAQKDRELVRQRAGHVDVVFGTHNLARAPALLRRAAAEGPVVEILDAPDPEALAADLPGPRRGPRAALRGLGDHPDRLRQLVRLLHRALGAGREVSRPFDDLVAEVAALARRG